MYRHCVDEHNQYYQLCFRSFTSELVFQTNTTRTVPAIILDEDDFPAPPPGPPTYWKTDEIETLIDIDVDPPRPKELHKSAESESIEEPGFLSRVLEKFSFKNLVDGQFEYGFPGISELTSAIQEFAYWGPNLVAIDAVKSVFERSLLVDRFVLDFDW